MINFSGLKYKRNCSTLKYIWFSTLYNYVTLLYGISFLVTKMLGEKNNDYVLNYNRKMINFTPICFKMEIIYIEQVVSMNNLFCTWTTSLCIRYLRDNLKNSAWVMGSMYCHLWACYRFISLFKNDRRRIIHF